MPVYSVLSCQGIMVCGDKVSPTMEQFAPGRVGEDSENGDLAESRTRKEIVSAA